MSEEFSTFMEADFEPQQPWDDDQFLAEYDRLAERAGKPFFDRSDSTKLDLLRFNYGKDEDLDFNTLARQELARQ